MKKIFGCLVCLFVFWISAVPVCAQELPVEVNADSIDYDREKGMVTGVGHVVVNYQETTLLADKGSVNMKTKEATAQGNVQIVQKGYRLVGDSLYYNFEAGKGEMTNATAYYEPWYAKGEKIFRRSKEHYEVGRGFVTTCDRPSPHYSLRAKKIDIYPNNKIVAHNIILSIGKVPLFWFPYYSHSLKRSPWSFIPGYSKKFGGFFLTSFEFLNTPMVSARSRLDYRARRGIGVGVDGEYRLKEGGGGKVKTYYIRDKRHELSDGTVKEDDRYRASLSHYSSWKHQTTLRGQFHKLSDKEILKDFFQRDSDYAFQPSSFFDISKYDPKYSLRFFVQKRVNNFFTEVERLPEVSLDFRRQRIRETPLFYTSLNSVSNLTKRFADETTIEVPGRDSPIVTDSLDAVRFDTYDEISYPKKYFGWLETNTWFGIRQTWYSRDLRDEDSLWRGSFSDGIELGTKIYRLWGYENKEWDIHELRHVIEPRVKYSYIFDPTVESARLPQFDQVDSLTGQNTIRPSIRNKLQTKRNNQVWDLIDFLLFMDFFVSPKSGQEPFSNIFGDLELRPFYNLSLDLDFSYDHYENRVSSFNTDIAIFNEGKWRVATGFRFNDQSSALWSTVVDYTINSDWAVSAMNRWEFETGELEEQQYTIHRDLHCWDGSFTFRKVGDDTQFWVVFWLKAFPDVPIDIGN